MIELSGIAVGDRLRLVGDVTAEVVEIVSDEWARVRIIESGAEELGHATDIVEAI